MELYRSEYAYALTVDPIGLVLGRTAARFEWRYEPNFSHIIELAFDRDIDSLKTSITSDAIPTYSSAFGMRLYLRDNDAIEGLFAGIGAGGTLMNERKLGLRVTAEIGYKWVLGGSGFFLEPQLIIDAYVLRVAAAKPFFSYVALPFGIAWK